MKRALLIGIGNYAFGPLLAPENDTLAMAKLLSTNDDENYPQNFSCEVLLSHDSSPGKKKKDGVHVERLQLTKGVLKSRIAKHFQDSSGTVEVAVLYFAGHGYENELGGYLVTTDANRYDEGVPMQDLIQLANDSPIREIVIILDCCHSGKLGNAIGTNGPTATLRQGISILTSSASGQSSIESKGRGLFTSILCDALSGGAADVAGNVTVASMYNYADQMLGAFDQRPIFKAHISRIVRLRKGKAKLTIPKLLRLTTYFDAPDHLYQLNPSYQKRQPDYVPEHGKIFNHLQELTRAGLVEPVGEEHMFYAAIHSKCCRLTPIGQFYWHLVDQGKINRIA